MVMASDKPRTTATTFMTTSSGITTTTTAAIPLQSMQEQFVLLANLCLELRYDLAEKAVLNVLATIQSLCKN